METVFQEVIHTDDTALFPCLGTPAETDFPTFELPLDVNPIEGALANSIDSGEHVKLAISNT